MLEQTQRQHVQWYFVFYSSFCQCPSRFVVQCSTGSRAECCLDNKEKETKTEGKKGIGLLPLIEKQDP